MDKISKGILAIIAVALCAITFKLYLPSTSFSGKPTFGDFIALREIKDSKQREKKYLNLMKSLPLIRIQGGNIAVDVSGNVSIDN